MFISERKTEWKVEPQYVININMIEEFSCR